MDYELTKNINESSGVQKTGDGANEKGAVTAKLSWQNDMNAAVDGAWQLPPFCKYPVAVLLVHDGTKGLQDKYHHEIV